MDEALSQAVGRYHGVNEVANCRNPLKIVRRFLQVLRIQTRNEKTDKE